MLRTGRRHVVQRVFAILSKVVLDLYKLDWDIGQHGTRWVQLLFSTTRKMGLIALVPRFNEFQPRYPAKILYT